MAHSHKLDIPWDIMSRPSHTVNIPYCKQLRWGKGKVTMQGITTLLITIYKYNTDHTPLSHRSHPFIRLDRTRYHTIYLITSHHNSSSHNQYSSYQWWLANWLSLDQLSECLVPTQWTGTGLRLSKLTLREQGPNQVSKRLKYNIMEHSPISKSKSIIIGSTLGP